MNGITFASVATGGAYGSATFSASASGTLPPTTTTLAGGVVWSTQNPLDNESLLYYFTVPYLGAHELSWPSFRYAYITWIVIGFVFVVWSIAHLLTRRKSNPAGVFVRKIGMKQIAWGGKWSQPQNGKPQSARKRIWVTPTIAQMIAMTVILVVIFCLSYLGPDYLSPTECTWGGRCEAAVSQGPPKSTFNAKRSLDINLEPSVPQPAARYIKPSVPRDLVFREHDLQKRREGKWGNLNPDGWAPYNDPLLAGINYEIDKNWWVSSSRVGMIAYVLLPLSVTLALKMWPFAVFAVPMLINYGIDKTAVFHHWFGRIIWVLSTVHVGLWSKQLFLDYDPYGYPVFFAMWKYWRFNAGVVAYVALTLMVILSLQPFRNRFYEIFYYSHCALIIAFLLGCALHYRYLDPYPFIALALWGTERITRLLFWFYTNGFTQGLWFTEKRSAKLNRIHHVASPVVEKNGKTEKYDSPYSPQPPHAFVDGALLSAESSRTMLDDQYDSASTIRSLYKPPANSMELNPALTQPVQDPPPGFALYQLLPGRNIRITLRTPRTIRWKTGQSVSLTVPSVAFWQGHPFTIASADDRTTHKEKSGRPGNTFSMLVQTRKGFTKSLWNKLVKERQSVGAALVRQQGGVYLRTQISLPYGSAARMNLDDQASTLILCGGTGVSFGMAVFEHVCHNMANHRGRNSRVRFVWILREHAHLTWIATAVRKCLDLCPPDRVQIDFYVTREDGSTTVVDPAHVDSLLPPRPGFVLSQRRESDSSLASGLSTNTPAEVGDVVGESVLDYVVFDGEDEAPDSEERNMSRRVEKEGKMRRAKSRKEKSGRKGFLGLGHKKEASSSTINGHSYPPNLAYTFGDATPDTQTPIKESDPRSYFLNDRDHSRPASPASPAGSDTEFDYPQHGAKRESHQSDHSINNLMSASRNFADSNDGVALDVYERDQQDLDIIAELARTGRPDIGKTIDEELRICQSKLLVACCGPLALNVKVRELVSQRMSPGKSSTAQMTFWSEDYEG